MLHYESSSTVLQLAEETFKCHNSPSMMSASTFLPWDMSTIFIKVQGKSHSLHFLEVLAFFFKCKNNIERLAEVLRQVEHSVNHI